MKRILKIMLVMLISFSAYCTYASESSEEMRGVWITTIYNLDYPSRNNLNNVEAQKKEFIEKLEQIKEMGLNTVFVQVRPKSDALYASAINPWSEFLTGVQGKNPGYDPMAFMIEEAHKRGIKFHAWLNPYRVTTSGTNVEVLSENHPARLNPSWVFSYKDALYYDPANKEVIQYIVDTVQEIVQYYDVDGIQFDDYFYPSFYPLPKGENKDGLVANERRASINEMVQSVSETIKQNNIKMNKSVEFGISPPGIWKNSTSDITGSKTSGREAYYAVFADSRTWIKEGWVDYIAPQIYWQIGHEKANYETLLKWWSKEVAGTSVKLYIGQGTYVDSVAKEIKNQLKMNETYPEVEGSIYFSLRELLNNRQNCRTQITEFYKGVENNVPSKPAVSPISKMGTVKVEDLNLRVGGRVDRDVITQLKKGTVVTILDELNGWYKVKLLKGTVGWVNSHYIEVGGNSSTNNGSIHTTPNKVIFPFKGVVLTDYLNVRVGASLQREVIKQLNKGTTVLVVSELNGWYKLRFEDASVGWVSQKYIKSAA